MSWNVARTGKRRNTRIYSENMNRRDYMGNLSVDGRITLNRILNKWGGGCGLDSAGSKWWALVNTVMDLLLL